VEISGAFSAFIVSWTVAGVVLDLGAVRFLRDLEVEVYNESTIGKCCVCMFIWSAEKRQEI